MVAINRRTFIPEVIIYIGNLDLEYITEKDDFLVIGSMTTHDSIVRSKIINEKIPLLSECVKTIGSPAIRNMGTIGGNLVNASPASDSAVALLALQARLRLTSNNGSRIIDLDTFFMGPGQTILNSDELVKEIIIPIPVSGAKWGWRKMGLRKAETCSVVSVAVMLEKEVDICGGLRICLGAVAPIPMVIKEVEILAKDKRLSQTLIMELADLVSQEISPIDDVRATAWYRRKVSAALVRQLLSDWVE